MKRSGIIVALLLSLFVVGCNAQRLDVRHEGGVVRMVYFYSTDCSHCQTVQQEVLEPLLAQYGEQIEIRWIDIYANGRPENYELLIRAEEQFGVAAAERALPTLLIDGEILIGEEEITIEEITCLVENCFPAGAGWPNIPGFDQLAESNQHPPGSSDYVASIDPSDPFDIGSEGAGVQCREDGCEYINEVWAAYFYEPGCQNCSRAEYDIRYVREQRHELIIDEFNVNQDAALAYWLLKRTGRELDEFHTPAIFIGTDVLIGPEEITPQNIEALLEKYAATGTERVWKDFDPASEMDELVGLLPGLTAIAGFGLLDGLNPCAFATLIFLIAYLAAGERKGRDILLVGGLFTLGVFLAYLAVGLGLHAILDNLLGEHLAVLGRWVSGLTALFCLVLAVYSFLDFLKARRGQIEDMSLSLPGFLKKRIRAVIREGQKARAYFFAALVTGVVVSLLELACTGQVYIPIIISLASIPGLRLFATGYLVIYNLFFVLPLVVVFVLTYFGTSSLQLGRFLQKRTATIKLGTTLLFAALAIWLGWSVLNNTGIL
ncbi:MAG: hypothetical protein JW900_07820 [Anaerolineae bacterium]|nr:hypothetical protein [Anaerolineae bacterium]